MVFIESGLGGVVWYGMCVDVRKRKGVIFIVVFVDVWEWERWMDEVG